MIPGPSLPLTGKRRHPPRSGSNSTSKRFKAGDPPRIDLTKFLRQTPRHVGASIPPPSVRRRRYARRTYLSDSEDDGNKEQVGESGGRGEQAKDGTQEMVVKDGKEDEEEDNEHEAPEEDKEEVNESESGTDEEEEEEEEEDKEINEISEENESGTDDEEKKDEEAGEADEENARMSVDEDPFQNDAVENYHDNVDRSEDGSTEGGKQERDSDNGNLASQPFGDEILDKLYDDMVNSPENATATRRDLAVLMMLVRDARKNRNSSPRSSSPLDGRIFPQSSTKPKTFDTRQKSDDMVQLDLEVRAYCNEKKICVPERLIKVPTRTRIKRSNNTKKERDGPKLEDPHLDLASRGPASEWNKRAASVFAKDFITNPESSCKDEKVVRGAFKVHLEALKSRHLKQEQGDSDSDNDTKYAQVAHRKVLQSRRVRRRLLLQRRKAVMKTFISDPSIQRFSHVLDTMPAEAMSGDESEHEARPVRYAITTLKWRNPSKEVISWFRSLDALHVSTRFTINDQPRQGGFPRPRINSQRIEQADAPVPGLPRNFYNPSWLETLDQYELESLDIQDPIDLSFSPKMTYIATRFAQVITRNSFPLRRNHPSLLALKG